MLALLLKETKSTTIKHTIHSKINNERVYIDYRVSGFLLQRFFAGFPKFGKKKKQKTAKTYTNAQILVITISILIISQYSNI